MQRFSYPRTFHLPGSPGATSDDKRLTTTTHFNDKMIVVTEKRDGENTTLYPDGYVHARSIDGTGKEYQSWIIAKWREVSYQLDKQLRVCGENLFARHSIEYTELDDFFEVFAIFDTQTCLSWNDVEELSCLLGLKTVPVMYKGIWDNKLIHAMCEDIVQRGGEGLVVRSYDTFETIEFSRNVAKYVRANHVQTDKHWTKNWTANTLKVGKLK